MVEFWRAGEISQREKKTRDHAKDDDPKALEDGMPKMPEIETAPSLY